MTTRSEIINVTQQLAIRFLDSACKSFNDKLASCGKLLTGESRDAQFQRVIGLCVGFIYILAENIVAKLTWTAVICRICACCCDCRQAAEGVRLKVWNPLAPPRGADENCTLLSVSLLFMLYAKNTFENHETALYFLSLYCSCYMPRTHLRIMKLLQNHVQILHMSRYWLILGHRTFFIYKCILTRTGRRATYQKNIIIIYLYVNSCEEFIRLNLQRCNTHESPQEGHLGPLTFLHFSLV